MAYKVEGYAGIAWNLIKTTEEGEKVCVMVGDDREFLFPAEDVTPVDDLDYCLSCGQIGCHHDGRER